jgi:hypothetical protein
MDTDLTALVILLALIFSLVYWIAGGVFFALMALLRLGRVRKVRFSCLFSLLAFACGIGAAVEGVKYSRTSLDACLVSATTKAQTLVALFGCGLAGILGTFLLGAGVLVLGGFLIMAVSKTSTKRWVNLNDDGEEPGEPVA